MSIQPKRLEFDTTRLLTETLAAKTSLIIHEGGTRSGKTWQLIFYWLVKLTQERGKVLSIVRKTLPALRISAQRDFFDILKLYEIYDDSAFNRGTNSYEWYGNTIEFMSVDDPQKKRGSARDYLWINEANELDEDDARQLMLRTRSTTVMDYNPSGGERHWIRRNILTRGTDKVTVVHSTYLDNLRFLTQEIIDEIEYLKNADPVAWSVFGLGIWATLKGKIYTNWVESFAPFPAGQAVYGIDFGHAVPTAVVKILADGNDLYWQEIVYETNLTNSDLIVRLKAEGVPKGAKLYCDAAEPDRIEELRRAGFDAIAAKKDVDAGIDFCRRYRIVLVSSPHLADEIAEYKMKQTKDGETLDEPLKYNDHAMDAGRYGTFTHYFSPPAKTQYKSVTQRETFKDGAW